MTSRPNDLHSVAERLDETPTEILNGGSLDALNALAATAPTVAAVASARGIDTATVSALWERTGTRLRQLPDANELFPAAAEAATLLHAAAWVMDSESATAEGLRTLMWARRSFAGLGCRADLCHRAFSRS